VKVNLEKENLGRLYPTGKTKAHKRKLSGRQALETGKVANKLCFVR